MHKFINSVTILKAKLKEEKKNCSVLLEYLTKNNRLDLLRCKLHSDQRLGRLNSVFAMNQSLKNFSDEKLVSFLLCGSENFTFSLNEKNLNQKQQVHTSYA